MKTLIFLLLSSSFAIAQENKASEKLLDKIVAVINTKVISLSEINRMEVTLPARLEVSPMVYTESKYDQKKLLEVMLRSYIIRDKINAQGYVINDDAVESRIKMTEERLGLKRADLLTFLKSKKLTYEEYFEIIRETMEYNIFAQRIISPLISVTEQEIKNEYYRKNSSNNALSFKYNLVDFYVPVSTITNKNEEKFLSVLKDYQLTGKLPEEYSGLESNNLENLNEDGLSKETAKVLKTTAEGSFSKAITLNDNLHVFYVQKKDLVESQEFAKNKDEIQNSIFMEKGKSVTTNWFDREYSNYYIKNLL
ncbi:MAG TPA: peptidylprolyl isomerase [Bacteriovoracaceae bacterium]|nr:peptidylprolyl isomerase [Bacteriovoracaceae bacterium]